MKKALIAGNLKLCCFFLFHFFFVANFFFPGGKGCLMFLCCGHDTMANYLMSQGAHQWSVRNGVCAICLWLWGSMGSYMVVWLCFLSLLVCVVRLWVVTLQMLMHHLARCHNEYSFPFSLLLDEQYFYKCPDRLRLPLIFYLCHTATLYVNKLLLAGMIEASLCTQLALG